MTNRNGIVAAPTVGRMVVGLVMALVLVPTAFAHAFGPYCGDGTVNQAWEQCDGGSQCTDKCLLPNQCVDVILARVVVVNSVESTETIERPEPVDPYVGGSTENDRVPPTAWFPVYYNGVYFNDADISGYEVVAEPELVVQRAQGSIRLRWHSHYSGNSNTIHYEYVTGYVEMFQANVTGQTVDSAAPLESGFAGDTWYRDTHSVSAGRSNFAFVVSNRGADGWLWGVSDAFTWNHGGDIRDGLYTNYTSTVPQCVLPEPVCDLTASPTIIDDGEASTLTWTTDEASSVSINQGIGNVSLDGSRTVRPDNDTTYTLTATNAQGATRSCSVTVEVREPEVPSCELSVSRSSVTNGEGVTLDWDTEHAYSAVITSPLMGSVALDGSRTVYPWQDTTYTMTVYGARNQTATCSAHVDVVETAAPTCWINANPSYISDNGSTSLQWGSNNADSATITDLGSVSTDGSRTVYPGYSRTYTMTVRGHHGQTATCQTSVTMQQYQTPSCSISVSPTALNSGNSAVLNWSTSGNVSSSYISSIGSVSNSGSQTVWPSGSTTYTMTVYGQNGQTNTCTAYVTMNTQSNLYCSIVASPSSIASGASTVLAWTATGATSASLSDGIGSVSTSGTRSVSPASSRTYTLTITDAQGRTNTCATNVNVGPNVTITLNQVPYTGFDLGVFGNAMYFLALSAVSVGAAYMLFFHNGGAFGFMFRPAGEATVLNERVLPGYAKSEDDDDNDDDGEVHTGKRTKGPRPTVTVSEIVEPIARERAQHRDSLSLVADGSSTPRLVITREQSNSRELPR